MQGSDGALYGTTGSGGSNGAGTVFKLNLDGTGYTVLYNFGSTVNDGANPGEVAVVQATGGALYGMTFRGGDQGFGTVFRLRFPGFITALDPPDALANGPSFNLTVVGTCFEPGSTLLWNGTPRPTTVTSSTQLFAAILDSDIASTSTISTATVTVLDPDGSTSNPQLFTITSPSVSGFQSMIVPLNESVNVATPNISNQGNEAAVAATVNNAGGSDPISATAATYTENPTSGNVIDVGGGYVDLRIVGADESDSAAATFYYPSSVTGATEDNLTLWYYSGTSWAPVLSSGASPPVQDTTDDLDGTVSGGRFSVTFDNSSTPSITQLGGTVFAVALNNSPPVIDNITGSAPTALGVATSVTVNFTDLEALQTHTGTFNWDDGSSTSIQAASGVGSITASHTYATPGVYTVGVTISDGSLSDTKTFQFLVVYDPSGGFVTGGGWINSPAGAYPANPSLTGRANFGFTSKYKKGASLPIGQTEFQLQLANFNFHSDAYQWLVVAGPKAQYKGTGTVNGIAGYGFLLTARDGQAQGGGGVDKFRIKIWNSEGIAYDNAIGSSDDIDQANPQAIAGGSIVIHK